MTQVTEAMIEAGARVHCPFAFEDADTMPIHRAQSRDEARKEVRAILEAALAEHGILDRLRNAEMTLWLILKSNDGYELEHEDIAEYPSDDLAVITQYHDPVTKSVTFRASSVSRQERQSEKSADIIGDAQS